MGGNVVRVLDFTPYDHLHLDSWHNTVKFPRFDRQCHDTRLRQTGGTVLRTLQQTLPDRFVLLVRSGTRKADDNHGGSKIA